MYQQSPRPAARAGADPQADGRPRACSAARPAAASTPTSGRTRPVVVDDALTPAAGAEPVRRRAPVQRGRRRRARAPWRPASSRCSPRPGTTSLYVARGDEKVAGVRAAVRALAGQGGAARQARRRGRATPRWPASPARPGSTTSPTATSSSRRWSRSCRSSRRCSRRSTRSASRARCWRRRPRACRWSSCAMATRRPDDVVGLHFFNPAPVMQARRGGLDGRAPPPRSRPPRSSVCERLGKHAVTLRRPGRLHRQRAAVPVPQRRGQDARGALRDRRRHRHRDEGRLRLPDGPVRAARRGRARRVAGDPARRCTSSSASRGSRRPRCSSTWSRRATSGRKSRPRASGTTYALRPADARAERRRREASGGRRRPAAARPADPGLRAGAPRRRLDRAPAQRGARRRSRTAAPAATS